MAAGIQVVNEILDHLLPIRSRIRLICYPLLLGFLLCTGWNAVSVVVVFYPWAAARRTRRAVRSGNTLPRTSTLQLFRQPCAYAINYLHSPGGV